MLLPVAEKKLDALRRLLREQTPLLVAYSGGVDSAFLLAVAVDALGDNCEGVIADSPSLPRQALVDAKALAQQMSARLRVIPTTEMDDPSYTSNSINRCYFCKAELFTRLDALARAEGFRAIAYGENADDALQVRPGREAAAAFRVLAPLRDVGLTKKEIRALSRMLQLPTADAPAQPCLSSRIPHGTPVTVIALGMIERAETIVRSYGFRIFRVRHHLSENRPQARIEILPDEMPHLTGISESLCAKLRELGYDEVVIDPRGYRAPAALPPIV
ncbi:MAG TPA: ATP-dependent sacrificial sulfur transferase LarE [Chthoniobacterales bacterium]